MNMGKSSRYGFLFSLPPDDYEGWAIGLQKAGYATNPQYAKLLIRIIEEEKLYTYDTRRLDEDLATKYLPNSRPEVRDGIGEYESYVVRFQNDIPYIVAADGDNVKNISKRMDIPARKLVRFNELVEDKRTQLESGDRVYLQPMKEDCEPAPGSVLVLSGKQKKQIRCATDEVIFASAQSKRNPPEIPRQASPPAAEVSSAEPRTETIIIHTASAPSAEIYMPELLSYTVQPKDTLYQIAMKHGVSVGDLKKLNNLSSDMIHPGQELKVRR
jgi:LysM repeat protein